MLVFLGIGNFSEQHLKNKKQYMQMLGVSFAPNWVARTAEIEKYVTQTQLEPLRPQKNLRFTTTSSAKSFHGSVYV